MRMAEAALESLERAVQEVEALEAIFGYEDGGFTLHSEGALSEARSATEAAASALPEGWAAPQLEIELQLALEGVEGRDDGPVPTARLRCGLPPGYPATASAIVSVSVPGLRRARQDELSAQLTAKAAELLGDEAVTELAQELQEIAPAAFAEELAAAGASSAEPEPEPEPRFGRRWLWMHHIKNPTKRANIVAWARERSLGGYSKPGYPGVRPIRAPLARCVCVRLLTSATPGV